VRRGTKDDGDMVSIRVLGVSLASALAWSGCGGAEGAGLQEPVDTGSGASGVGGGLDGSGGANSGRSGNDGGGSGGTSDGGGGPSDGGSTGGDAGSDSGEVDGGASSGCGQAPAFQGGTYELDVGGLTRTFIVDIPSDYSQDERYPIVFGFHGRDFSGAEFRDASYGDLLSAAGDAAILVHPDATEAGAWELDSQVDVEFFDAMLDVLSRGLCVDETRVFATGHSSGGYFTNVLGCQRGDVLRGIAPVAGGGPIIDGEQPTCTGPVSAWIAHGEDDPTVPFLNGEGSLEYWLGSDGCDAESAESVEPDPCVAYSCSAGFSVHWCAHAGGHDWPGFAAAGIWSFFESL
jgi:poly(3-hydroxybutyrate) depolymerase